MANLKFLYDFIENHTKVFIHIFVQDFKKLNLRFITKCSNNPFSLEGSVPPQTDAAAQCFNIHSFSAPSYPHGAYPSCRGVRGGVDPGEVISLLQS